MVKVTELEDVAIPEGDEPVIIISGGRAKRTRFDRLLTVITAAAIAARDLAVQSAQSSVAAATSTGADRASTGADRVAVHADRLAADADAVLSAAAKAAAQAAAEASGGIKFYDTRADANAALAGLPDQQVIEVNEDETRARTRTRYRKQGGAYAFKLFFPRTGAIYADSRYGDDANDGSLPQPNGQGGGPVKTLARLGAVCGGFYLSGPDAFTGRGPRAAATVSLARGSRWNGEGLTNLPPFCRVTTHGQGSQPIIDASVPLPLAWTYEASSGLYYQDVAIQNAATGPYPSGANYAHWMAFDEGLGFDIVDDGLPRALNGDPLPDPQYDAWQPQKTTIAVTSQAALKAILSASVIGGFTVFAQGSSAYEPRVTWAGGAQAMRVWIKMRDSTNPNTNGRTIYIVGSSGCAEFSQGCSVEDVTFARSGSKDMCSAYSNASPEHLMVGVSAGVSRRCRFLQHGGHGPVDRGMSHYDGHARGGYMRDHMPGCGSYHGFRENTILGLTAGRIIGNCLIERGGIAVYTHGDGAPPVEQHVLHQMIDCRLRDVAQVMVPGQTGSAAILRCSGVDIGSVFSPDTTCKTALIEDCRFTGRDGGSIGVGQTLPGTSITLRRTEIRAGRNGFVNLLWPDFRGSIREIDPATYPTMTLIASKLAGRVDSPGNSAFMQVNVVMDAASYLGVFDPVNLADTEMWIRGSITAAPGARIECARTSIETVRAAYPGVAAGVETGVRRQVWSKTVLTGDMAWLPSYFAAYYGGVDNGDGTATIQTDYNYNQPARSLRIPGRGAGGADYIGRVVALVDASHFKVTPPPPAAFGGTAAQVGVLNREPFKAAVTAYVSETGLQLSVPDGAMFTVGQSFNVGQVRSSKPAFGLRRIAAVAGNLLTLDAPIAWLAKTNLLYNDITDPIGLNYAPLPTVQLSWGWSFSPPIAALAFSPSYTIAKVEGGTDDGELGWNIVGAVDYERGFLTSNKLRVAVGDAVTFTNEIDIPQLRGVTA